MRDFRGEANIMINCSELSPDSIVALPEDEQARIVLGILRLEHEQYVEEWIAPPRNNVVFSAWSTSAIKGNRAWNDS